VEEYNVIDVSDIALQKGILLYQKYRIEDIYYWGHTSILYICVDIQSEKKVMVKEFCPYHLSNRDMDGKSIICKGKRFQRYFEQEYETFHQECKIVEKLKNLKKEIAQCTLSYLDDFKENSTQYLVTEIVEGTTLDEVLEQGVELSVEKCMQSIMKTVRAIHKLGIYHRDIKPANIIINSNNNVVLVDFGSACYKKNKNLDLLFVSRGYSAPELYRKKKSYKGTDVYSIGALFYFLVSGLQPIAADDREEGEQLMPLSKLTEISPVLEYFITKSLELDKKRRLKNLWIWEKLLVG